MQSKRHIEQLTQAGIHNPAREYRWLREGLNHKGKTRASQLEKAMERRIQGEPLAYILEEKEFYSLPFVVNKHVLIPRSDSETFIDSYRQYNPSAHEKKTILDLGTGSGCLLLTLLTYYPNSTGIGVDKSKRALDIAIKNSKQLNVESRTKWVQSDWLRSKNIPKVNAVLCNPPYIATDDKETENISSEPKTALFAKDNGLEHYKKLSKTLHRVLKNRAMVWLEVGHTQANSVQCIMEHTGYLKYIGTQKDLAGIERVLVFCKIPQGLKN